MMSNFMLGVSKTVENIRNTQEKQDSLIVEYGSLYYDFLVARDDVATLNRRLFYKITEKT